jgi:ASC-1-like (ASCH) protein
MRMHLDNYYFEKIKEGTKTIEVRLNDEKRRELKVGDTITFDNRKTNEKLDVRVKNLYVYKNFEELYKHHDKISIGYEPDDVASPSDMRKYYSFEDTIKYGVVAIEIEVI